MFDLNKVDDLLPTYPSNVSGELRIILQIKDQFLVCFKYLESLNSLWQSQIRIITKEFILEQIKANEFDVKRLKIELRHYHDLIKQFQYHNDVLVKRLKNTGETLIANSSKHRIEYAGMNIFGNFNSNKSENCLDPNELNFIPILQNIADKIDITQMELKQKLRPILEYYKDVYYLQLHFTLSLTQISCYCMPLMTETVGLMDRLFFWSQRPEFELIQKSGQISDRFRDIYTRLLTIINILCENIKYLEQKIDLQKVLETKCYEKLKNLIDIKDCILDEIHSMKLKLDLLEEENDRLAGTLLKADPDFVDSNIFKEYAEHKSIFTFSYESFQHSISSKPQYSIESEGLSKFVIRSDTNLHNQDLIKQMDQLKVEKTVKNRLNLKKEKNKKYEVSDDRTDSLMNTLETFPKDKI